MIINTILNLFVILPTSLSFSLNNSNNKYYYSIKNNNNNCGYKNYVKKNDYVDAEFYPVEPNDDSSSSSPSPLSPSSPSSTKSTPRRISPLQMSLSSVEPKLSSLSFNFIDPSLKSASKQSFIPCRIAFIVNYNNVEYVLGTPVDTQVAIYVEDLHSNTAYFIDSDEDDNMELMERAASVFEEKYKHISLSDDDNYDDDEEEENGKEEKSDRKRKQKLSIRFKRTPRTLTVEGDLGMITGNWKEDGKKQFDEVTRIVNDIFDDNGDNVDNVEMKKEQDDDMYFDTFFTSELGDNYEEQAFKNSSIDEGQVQEMMELFNIPGLGTEKDDEEGVDELLKEIIETDKNLAAKDGIGNKSSATALRLIGFRDENDEGKMYSLVQLLQPMILVAKTDPSLEFDEKMLLTQEEADEIIPILEQQFIDEFEKAGVTLR